MNVCNAKLCRGVFALSHIQCHANFSYLLTSGENFHTFCNVDWASHLQIMDFIYIIPGNLSVIRYIHWSMCTTSQYTTCIIVYILKYMSCVSKTEQFSQLLNLNGKLAGRCSKLYLSIFEITHSPPIFNPIFTIIFIQSWFIHLI